MTIVMNMSGYEIERVEVAAEEYDDEVMYAEWVSQPELAIDSQVVEMGKRANIPTGLADADVDAFLRKMYEYQG